MERRNLNRKMIGKNVKGLACLLAAFLFFISIGCKKDMPVKKPAAEKVAPAEVKTDIRAPEEAKKSELEEYAYDARARRDPFLSLIVPEKQKPVKKKGASPIQSFDIEEIKILAIAWDKNKYYATVTLPDKKSFTITEGMVLGLQGGKVQKITENTITIREYVKDYKGETKQKDTVLRLHKGEEE